MMIPTEFRSSRPPDHHETAEGHLHAAHLAASRDHPVVARLAGHRVHLNPNRSQYMLDLLAQHSREVDLHHVAVGEESLP